MDYYDVKAIMGIMGKETNKGNQYNFQFTNRSHNIKWTNYAQLLRIYIKAMQAKRRPMRRPIIETITISTHYHSPIIYGIYH